MDYRYYKDRKDNKDYKQKDKKVCKSKVDSRTLPECPSDELTPEGIDGPLVAKIPVVLAEPVIQLDVKADIKLDEPAMEIKRVKKNVFLTQCKLICMIDKKLSKYDYKETPNDKYKCGKLFIGGFVRKNIEYATAKCKDSKYGCISGDIQHTTCRIPFECVTLVDFTNPPEMCDSSYSTGSEMFSTKFNGCDPCSEPVMGRDPCYQDFKHFENFNEQVYCELESAKIYEEDIHKNPSYIGKESKYEHVFDAITEKMVIFLRLKLLQKQQVNVPGPYGKDC